jgi:hypothetical protein
VQAEEVEARPGADRGDRVRRIREGDAELLVLTRRGEVLVGVRVDAAVEAEAHRLPAGVAGSGIRDPLDLDLAVDDDHADAHGHGSIDLGDRLVVAMEAEPGRVDPGGERDGEFSPAAHVDVQAGLGDPARDLGGEERLSGVVDPGGRADAGELAIERLAHEGRARTNVRLIDHEERRAETGGEVRDGHAGDLELTGCRARRPVRPEPGCERVRIGRMGEPRRGKRIDSHRETSGLAGGKMRRADRNGFMQAT